MISISTDPPFNKFTVIFPSATYNFNEIPYPGQDVDKVHSDTQGLLLYPAYLTHFQETFANILKVTVWTNFDVYLVLWKISLTWCPCLGFSRMDTVRRDLRTGLRLCAHVSCSTADLFTSLLSPASPTAFVEPFWEDLALSSELYLLDDMSHVLRIILPYSLFQLRCFIVKFTVFTPGWTNIQKVPSHRHIPVISYIESLLCSIRSHASTTSL